MFIRYIVGIWILGVTATAVAQDPLRTWQPETDLTCCFTQCVNIIKPSSGGGYDIFYGDGAPSDHFDADSTIVINDFGSYRLCGDVTGNYATNVPAIEINVSSVELDLADFSVIQEGSSSNGDVGIKINSVSDVTVKNGKMAKFYFGVYVLGDHVNLCNLKTLDCGRTGFVLDNSSATVSDVVLEGCEASNNPMRGFALGGNSISVINCIASLNESDGFGISVAGLGAATNIILDHCTAIRNGTAGGYGFNNGSSSAVLIGNFAYNNGSSTPTNYGGTGSVGSIVIANGGQLPPGILISQTDNIEII